MPKKTVNIFYIFLLAAKVNKSACGSAAAKVKGQFCEVFAASRFRDRSAYRLPQIVN